MINNFIKKLQDSISTKKTVVCCGLDPDISKFPKEYVGMAPCEAIDNFLKRVVDTTHPDVAAYKIQKAFFDIYSGGHNLLSDIVRYIRSKDPNIIIVLDGKIGDIDNTMEAYLKTAFEVFKVDAVTLNPYMGRDVWSLLKNYPGCAGIVLVKTSNKAARIIQNTLLNNGKTLWRYLLDIIIEEWKNGLCLIPVLSDHDTNELRDIRTILPTDMPIFYAGLGAQGAPIKNISYLLDSNGRGVLVNSSRGILYPYNPNNLRWTSAIKDACLEMKHQLNSFR